MFITKELKKKKKKFNTDKVTESIAFVCLCFPMRLWMTPNMLIRCCILKGSFSTHPQELYKMDQLFL